MLLAIAMAGGYADSTPNQAPASGENSVIDLPAASAMPVAAAMPLMVSLVPGAAKSCELAAPPLLTHITWPPTAGGRATLSPAVADTAISTHPAATGVAAALVPPECAVTDCALKPVPLARC